MPEQNDPTSSHKKWFSKKAAPQPETAPELDSSLGEENADISPDTAEPVQDDKASEPQADQATEGAVAAEDADKEPSESPDSSTGAPDTKAGDTKPGRGGRIKRVLANWWHNPKARWATIGAVVVVLAAVLAVPFTRYNVLGLVLTAPVTVRAVDSKTGKPVSGVAVQLAGKTAETNGEGVAVLHVHAGSKKLVVSKKYYTGSTGGKLVALSGNNFKVTLVALGRQVTVKVVSSITGKPVAAAAVSAQGATAKTNANGLATLIIPSGADTQSVDVTLAGYNTTKATVTAADDLAKNTFKITPAGKLYFLSNLSGRIDVVKTNLDGSAREVVLEGTGHEDRYSTSLLASRDWKYLALLAKRGDSDKASVYLIDTTNGDKLSTIDEGDAQFSLVGWSGSRFIYRVDRNGVANWQAHAQALKSFDPTTDHTLSLDQTQGSGSGQSDYARQQFVGTYLIDDQVVYTKTWYGFGSSVLNGKSSELDTIGADGSGHKTLKTFAPDNLIGYGYFNIDLSTRSSEPRSLYVGFNHDGTNDYYEYEDGKVTADDDMTATKFDELTYSAYLLSPSGNSTFWADQRDGKNVLFTGNKDAGSQKQVGSLTEYNGYGWYTDDYLLVSKNSSELYIMPAGGGTPVKITDYYKPAINYDGYGGGYGGQ
jgi:hypothetical protein